MRSGLRRGRKSSFTRSRLRLSSVLCRRSCGPLRRSTYTGEHWLRALVFDMLWAMLLAMLLAMLVLLLRLPGDTRMLTNKLRQLTTGLTRVRPRIFTN